MGGQLGDFDELRLVIVLQLVLGLLARLAFQEAVLGLVQAFAAKEHRQRHAQGEDVARFIQGLLADLLRGEEALPPVLILPPEGTFFDYKSKYADVSEGGAREICPAPLPEDVIRRMQEMALRAHKALGLRGYSRADFILTESGELFLLEVNTLPGMTSASLVPKEAAAVGLDFGALLERLMALRLEEKPCAEAARS